ncbi:hypothetical protein [Vulcanisaeta thermophila]|uniref:hypothetical protein n=1 Tax=Vulcanisaeta thermophila TaxID=867917 RepID=UPI0008536EA7|nr:hypothetical protein [Vulcanisaeta thermophila]
MRPIITSLALVLPLIPFALLIYYGYSITQYVALAFMAIALGLGINGLFRGGMVRESLFAFVSLFIIIILGEGYIPFLIHMDLMPINPQGIPAVNYSLVVLEFSIIMAQLSELNSRYWRMLRERNYDERVVSEALWKLNTWVVGLSSLALAVALGLYFLITSKPMGVMDPFTALLIFAVAYLIIVRYIYSRLRR